MRTKKSLTCRNSLGCLFFVFCGLMGVLILFPVNGQAGEQGWKKTITLPNGEIICDLNGVWDYQLSARGMTADYKSGVLLDVIEITQEGSFFKGVRLRGTQYDMKGEVAVEGEVDKNGIKKMYHKQGSGALATGFHRVDLISNGNIIEINEREFFLELVRK